MFVLRIFEQGLYRKWSDDSRVTIPMVDVQVEASSKSKYQPLALHHLNSIFVVYLLGVGLSLIAFGIEYVYGHST